MKGPRWQLLREWPPGYGGIERVAHELAMVWQQPVYSFDAQGDARSNSESASDPLPAPYARWRLPCLQIGRLMLPLPGRRLMELLLSKQPLHGHLPSPGVLLVLLAARLLQPRRWVSAHWHAFLEGGSGVQGMLFRLYQHLAIRVLPLLSEVITTSPVLADALVTVCGERVRVRVLPCCLDAGFESEALALPLGSHAQNGAHPVALRVLFIGRLDSYKRLDWLLTALAQLQAPWRLDVVGDGPRRVLFEQQAQGAPVHFHGRLDEAGKLQRLADADVLVLPSDRSNEAFGIVQLEAMAAAVPALAFTRPRSGMGWVGALPGLVWSQQPQDLAAVLERLALDGSLRAHLRLQARERFCTWFSRPVWHRQLRDL